MSEGKPLEQGSANALGTESVVGLLKEFLGFISARGKEGVGRVQERSRHQLEIRQLRKDRKMRLEKLGREVMALADGGEIDHPGVCLHIGQIQELDSHIQRLVDDGPTSHRVQVDSLEE
jgi:hypothetical protein